MSRNQTDHLLTRFELGERPDMTRAPRWQQRLTERCFTAVAVTYGERSFVLVPSFQPEATTHTPALVRRLMQLHDPRALVLRDYGRCRYCREWTERMAITVRPELVADATVTEDSDLEGVSHLTCERCARDGAHRDEDVVPRGLDTIYRRERAERRNMGVWVMPPRPVGLVRSTQALIRSHDVRIEERLEWLLPRYGGSLEGPLTLTLDDGSQHSFEPLQPAEAEALIRDDSSVPRTMRAAVRKRDQGLCRFCLRDADNERYVHVVPPRLGAPTVRSNVVLACDSCIERRSDAIWTPRNARSVRRAAVGARV